jgi:hypothetical protein
MKLTPHTTNRPATGLALVLAGLAACRLAAAPTETPDVRTRAYVAPVRVVASSGAGVRAEVLLKPKFGQVSEGRFAAGGGVLLSKGDWIILDFGRELHGSLQIGSGARSSRTCAVRVRFGESVSETMAELRTRAPNATATNEHAIRDDVVSLPWFGRREIGETGFRFVRLDHAGEGRVQIEYVRAVSTMRPMRRIGSFRCSDERLNRVFDTAVRTVHLCCQDYIWDGIKRDRLVWMGDTHPETKAILTVFGDADIIPATLDYAAATTPPEAAWMNGMATYTLWWVRNLAEWYRYTGDRDYLARHADYVARTFNRIASHIDDRGVWRASTFLDWPTQANRAASAAGTQGLLLLTLRETAFLAGVLGRRDLAARAEACARRVEGFRPEPRGVKSASALLALSGLRDPKEMFASSLGRDGHAGVSTFYGYYMLEAMSAAGETRRGVETVRDYWGAMLDMGATSFWEDFNLSWTNNAFRIDQMPVAGKKDIHGDFGAYCYVGFRHSLCHGWSAGPAPWLIERVLGIRSLEPGGRRVEVKPDLGGLSWAEGALALPGGRSVSVKAVRRKDGTVDVSVTAPPDVLIDRR